MKDLKKYFYTYLNNKDIADGYFFKTLMGHQIPIGGTRNEILSTQRAIIVGDAAGLADPITGEGIYYGLRSGQIAAEVIQRSFNRGYLLLHEYSKQINDEIIHDFKCAGHLAKVLYNLSFNSYNLSRKIDKINESFLKVVTGEYTYKDMFYRIPIKYFFWYILSVNFSNNLKYELIICGKNTETSQCSSNNVENWSLLV